MKREKYAVIFDATFDSAHVEQTAFLVRYLNFSAQENHSYRVEERLLCFTDCSQKSGKAIAELILNKPKQYDIPLEDFKGQGYDNDSNMKGAYNGDQAIILSANSEAVYSACTCHSLNLRGEQAANSCKDAMTFFGAFKNCTMFLVLAPKDGKSSKM